MPDSTIKSRLFLVGCPRSGTTLLQSLLAAHPDIASFPESHLFQSLWIHRWSRLLGLASPKGRQQLNWFLQEINQPQLLQKLPKQARFMRQYGKVLQEALDGATRAKGQQIWLEKSPEHVRYIRYIEGAIPDAKFIHLIRNGSDVVASLYDVTHKHRQPEVWGEPWELEKCIRHWVRSVEFSSLHLHKPNHILVRYEALVENPEVVIRELCNFIETPFSPSMLKDYGKMAEKVVLNNEAWKASVGDPISNANSTKFYKLFTPEQQQYILEKVTPALSTKI
ncbi:MAG: sulfotransferase [Microcoleaceae cyanobacterium]